MDRVCGLDVHKDSIFMCILTEVGEKIEQTFGTTTPTFPENGIIPF